MQATQCTCHEKFDSGAKNGPGNVFAAKNGPRIKLALQNLVRLFIDMSAYHFMHILVVFIEHGIHHVIGRFNTDSEVLQ